MQIESESGHMNVSITWPKVATIVVPVVATIAIGYWVLVERMIDGISASVSELRAETGERFQGREAEDSAIRSVIIQEVGGLRAEITRLGDRIVASTESVGVKIDTLRSDLLKGMQDGNALLEKRVMDGDAVLERRFERLEQQMDDLLQRIDFEWKVVPQEGGAFQVIQPGTFSPDSTR